MITISYPWVFIAIIFPFVVYWLLPKPDNKNSTALKVPYFKELLQSFSSHNINDPRSFKITSIKGGLWGLVWLLIVISGSGIAWLGSPLPSPQSGRDLMLAIDLSGSMQTPDMVINGKNLTRIDLVEQVANKFIEERIGDRLGLILFGSRPYLQTPLTFDRKTVSQMLADASIGIAGPQTAIGDAIGLAVKQLIDYPTSSKALILLTDGGNNAGTLEPAQAANLAKQAHIKIYTIGLGAKSMQVQTLFGTQTINPSSDLDIDGLKQIAALTGGQFFRAEDGNKLEQIYSQINRLEPTQADKMVIRPISPLYPWTLGLALGLSFILILIRIKRD